MGLLKDIKTQLKILESVNEGLSTSKVKRIKKKIESDKDFQKYFRDTGEDYDQALEMWLEDEGYSIGIESAEEAEELADAISQLPESVNEGLSTSDQQKVEKMFYAAKDKLGSRYNWKTHLTPIYHAISKKLKLNIDDVSGYLNLVGESVNEGKYDHLMGKPFEMRGKKYRINKIEGNKFAHVVDDRQNKSTFKLDFLVKKVPGFTLDKPKNARGPAWNKGQKTTSKREYEKILKGAMKDAKGMGDEEFTHDMATSMIYDPEIQSYINKTYPGFGGNKSKMIQRLQTDLEMYESVNEAFQSGDKVKIHKLMRQDMNKYKGKTGIIDTVSSDGYVMVRVKGFSRPMEFHPKELVNEGKEEFVDRSGEYELFKTFRHGGMMTHIIKKNGKEIKQYAPNLKQRVAIGKFKTEFK